MISDGVSSSNQMLLGEDIDAESVWKDYVAPFVIRKESDRFAHAEIMNMDIDGCQPVRRYLFYYGGSVESKQMFLEIMANQARKSPHVSILIGLVPSVRHATTPLLENTRTGTSVDATDVTRDTDGAYPQHPHHKWAHNVGFVFRNVTPGRQTEVVLKNVDEGGRSVAVQVFDTIRAATPEQEFELSYHSQCGPVSRHFFHYDPNDIPAAKRALHEYIQSDNWTWFSTTKGSYVIRFVARTAETEASLRAQHASVSSYPVMVEAASRVVSEFGRRRRR